MPSGYRHGLDAVESSRRFLDGRYLRGRLTGPIGYVQSMRLEGWNTIPDGYGARFETSRTPLWLRLWFRTPVLDKFAYPVVIRRGFGYLTPNLGQPADTLGEVAPGWQVSPNNEVLPGVALQNRPIARRAGLRRRRRRYVRFAQHQRFGRWLALPTQVHLSGGRLLERQRFLYWRIRLPLCAVLSVLGALIASWPGMVLGFATAMLTELVFSYRHPHGPTGTGLPT